MTVDEISLHKTDIFSSCRFILLFCRLRLFRCALRISGETLTPYGLFTSRSVFLEFVVSSPLSCWFICHRKYKFSFSLLGNLSDASTFSNSSISAIRISPFQIPPAINAYPWKILVILSYQIDEFLLNLLRILEGIPLVHQMLWKSFEWFPKSSFIWSFPVCQDILDIS